jgi:hypothetical protein
MTRFMNEADVEAAWRKHEQHPVLGPATKTLANLVSMVNATSDGWPYWRAPSRGAARLTDLIDQFDGGADVTEADYKRALTQLKAWRTRLVKSRGRGTGSRSARPLAVPCGPRSRPMRTPAASTTRHPCASRWRAS